MPARRLTLILCLAVIGNPFARDIWAKPRATNPVNLRVSVFNDANVSETELVGAQRAAATVFARAGIAVEWLSCGRPAESFEEQAACSEAEFPKHLHVRIVQKSLNLKISTFGMSYLDQDGTGFQADIFYEGLAILEQHARLSSATVLGTVMAHELGHLLLGTNSHSPTGLMRPLWNADDLLAASQGHLSFTEEQRQILRSRLELGSNLNAQR